MDPVIDHALLHLKHLDKNAWVIYIETPRVSSMGTSAGAIEDHVLVLTDADVQSILQDYAAIKMPALPVKTESAPVASPGHADSAVF